MEKRRQGVHTVPVTCDTLSDTWGGGWTRSMVVTRLEGGGPRREAEGTRKLLKTKLAYFLGHGGIF